MNCYNNDISFQFIILFRSFWASIHRFALWISLHLASYVVFYCSAHIIYDRRLCLGLHCCDLTSWPKSICGGKDSFNLRALSSHPITEEQKWARIQGRNQNRNYKEYCFLSLFSLHSYAAEDYQPWGVTIHSRMSLPALIISQANALHIADRAIL